MLDLAKGNKQFAAIDRAIGKDSFRVVLLLRLSPLLPLALSNYLYGLTSVDLVPYVLGSWVGMLPGTLAYVTAGAGPRPCSGCRAFDDDMIALPTKMTIVCISKVLPCDHCRKGASEECNRSYHIQDAARSGNSFM